MAKVRYLDGDTAGTVGYMSYPEIQEALKANPDSLEILDGNVENEGDAREHGSEADNAERGDVRRSLVAARDLHEEADPTVVTTEGHGTAGADAMRIGASVTHRSEALVPTSAGPKDREGVDPREASAEGANKAVEEQNRRADEVRAEGGKAEKSAAKNRRSAPAEKGE